MFKMFRKIKYAILSKVAERKVKKQYGSSITIKIEEFNVSKEDGTVDKMIKTEITTYQKDYKNLINNLFKKGQ